jgi:hypothetical protein
MVFSAAASGYAEEAAQPKGEDAYAASQKDALKQWKEMRDQSDISETAGQRSVMSNIFSKAVTAKTGVKPSKKAAAVAAEKALEAPVKKAGDAATEKIDETLAEKAKLLPKPSKTAKPPKSKKTKSSGKKDNLEQPVKATTPDGTTKTAY